MHRNGFLFLGLMLILALAIPFPGASQPTVFPGESWQWAENPESLGWSATKLATARAYSQHIGSAAVMIVDRGLVVDAWGDLDRNFNCHSVRKSLLSALYGIYAAEGKIDLDATLADLEIDDEQPLTDGEKQATVADLLQARSGVYVEAAGEAQSMKDTRPARGSHPPGTFWYYNNWDFNALGTIFDRLSGEENIYRAFDRRIARPLGMEDFQVKGLRYTYAAFSQHPYYGFRMSARDLARFALLFLNEGHWAGEQIIPADWVRASTAPHSSRGGADSGYGYMWWTGVNGGLLPNVRVAGPGYYASGYGGQMALVLPYRDLVIVHRANTDRGNMVEEQQIGVLLWLILDAAGEKELGDPPILAGVPPELRLAAPDIRDTLGGHTIRRADGTDDLAVKYRKDGSATLHYAGQMLGSGRWWTEGDRYCHQFEVEGMNTPACFDLVRIGDTIRAYNDDGYVDGAFRLVEESAFERAG